MGDGSNEVQEADDQGDGSIGLGGMDRGDEPLELIECELDGRLEVGVKDEWDGGVRDDLEDGGVSDLTDLGLLGDDQG